MVSIVAKKYEYVIGVDTHARKHIFVLINNIGEIIGAGEVRVLAKDFAHMLSYVKVKTSGSRILFAIEGTSSYGETLTRFLLDNNIDVCEVKPPKVKARSGTGKSDRIDAEMAARGVLHLPIDKLIRPRTGNGRKILRILLASRALINKQQTMEKNALNSLIRGTSIGVDARKAVGARITRELACSRTRPNDTPQDAAARVEAKRLATSILEKESLLTINEAELLCSVKVLAPELLALFGVGPVCAAAVICAYSHKGRIRSSAAFASLAGVAPIPASSGNVVRHRLNRYGDRALNQTLDVIAKCRMRNDAETKLYVEKRTAAGLSYREIKRSLKRYIARNLFKQLESLELGVD